MSNNKSLQKTLSDIRNDLTSVTFLVESLYFCHFRTIPLGEYKLEQFRINVQETYIDMTRSHRQIAGSDDNTEGIFEAISASLARIQSRLRG